MDLNLYRIYFFCLQLFVQFIDFVMLMLEIKKICCIFLERKHKMMQKKVHLFPRNALKYIVHRHLLGKSHCSLTSDVHFDLWQVSITYLSCGCQVFHLDLHKRSVFSYCVCVYNFPFFIFFQILRYKKCVKKLRFEIKTNVC